MTREFISRLGKRIVFVSAIAFTLPACPGGSSKKSASAPKKQEDPCASVNPITPKTKNDLLVLALNQPTDEDKVSEPLDAKKYFNLPFGGSVIYSVVKKSREITTSDSVNGVFSLFATDTETTGQKENDEKNKKDRRNGDITIQATPVASSGKVCQNQAATVSLGALEIPKDEKQIADARHRAAAPAVGETPDFSSAVVRAGGDPQTAPATFVSTHIKDEGEPEEQDTF